MKLLIDGYNLCKQISGVTLLSSTQREQYIKMLASYVKIKQLEALLVFDGGLQERASFEETGLLEIVYVGRNKTADDFIKDFLQTHHTKDLLLVSSDRELNRIADYYGVPSIDVFDFWYFVKNAPFEKKMPNKISSQSIKTSSSINPELDELMTSLKESHIKKEEIPINNNNKRLDRSKIDKKLLQKVKKL